MLNKQTKIDFDSRHNNRELEPLNNLQIPCMSLMQGSNSREAELPSRTYEQINQLEELLIHATDVERETIVYKLLTIANIASLEDVCFIKIATILESLPLNGAQQYQVASAFLERGHHAQANSITESPWMKIMSELSIPWLADAAHSLTERISRNEKSGYDHILVALSTAIGYDRIQKMLEKFNNASIDINIPDADNLEQAWRVISLTGSSICFLYQYHAASFLLLISNVLIAGLRLGYSLMKSEFDLPDSKDKSTASKDIQKLLKGTSFAHNTLRERWQDLIKVD